MRILNFKSLLFLCLTLAAGTAAAQEVSDAAAKALPRQVGDFREIKTPQLPFVFDPVSAEDFLVSSTANSDYAAPNGERYNVSVTETRTTSAAYSLLRYAGGHRPAPYNFRFVRGLGVTGVAGPRVKFIKGTAVVHVSGMSEAAGTEAATLSFAGRLAAAVEGSPGDVPELVLHLPEWDRKHAEALDGVGYAVRPAVLQSLLKPQGQPVLDAVDFDGGVEAATAAYGAGRLVVVEFTTPQHAFDADAAVRRRIEELRAAGQPVPAHYRREGNYAVFVFDTADAAAAEQLAAGVKYEKDVRWLGRNPRAQQKAERAYTQLMGGTILAVIMTTGLAIVGCLAIGGAVGGFIFLRRRSRLAEQEVYTDAGGMLRLGLENMNVPPASSLLGQGEK